MAADSSQATAEDTARLDHELAERHEALGHMLTLLDQAGAGTTQTAGQGFPPQG